MEKAYFIGGPEDLTKRVIPECIEILRFPVFRNLLLYKRPPEEYENFGIYTVEYRLIGKTKWGYIYEYVDRNY